MGLGVAVRLGVGDTTGVEVGEGVGSAVGTKVGVARWAHDTQINKRMGTNQKRGLTRIFYRSPWIPGIGSLHGRLIVNDGSPDYHASLNTLIIGPASDMGFGLVARPQSCRVAEAINSSPC